MKDKLEIPKKKKKRPVKWSRNQTGNHKLTLYELLMLYNIPCDGKHFY